MDSKGRDHNQMSIYERPDISTLDYAVYADDVTMTAARQITVPINLKNATPIATWQAELVLPEGFSIATDEFGDPMIAISGTRTNTSRHAIATNTLSDGSIKILYSSASNKTIAAGDGEIATITLNVSEDVVEADYPLIFRNILMVEPNETGHRERSTVTVITAKNFTPGDVNNDGEIDALDLVAMVNYILETPKPGNIFEAADLDHDGEITAIDYVAEVNLILADHPSLAPAREITRLAGSLEMESFCITPGDVATSSIRLEETSGSYTCLQFDLSPAWGLSLTDARSLVPSHSLAYQTLPDGTVRFLLASPNNLTLDAEEELISLTFRASADMVAGDYLLPMTHSFLVTPAAGSLLPTDTSFSFHVAKPSAITSIDADTTATHIYNMSGQRMHDGKPLPKGLYIRNGQKVMK